MYRYEFFLCVVIAVLLSFRLETSKNVIFVDISHSKRRNVCLQAAGEVQEGNTNKQ